MGALSFAHLAIDLPVGWEGRGFARPAEVAGEHTRPVLHLANFALPNRVEDYGGGAVEMMRAGDAFVSLLDFGPESAGTPLFAHRGLPTLTASSFDPNLLQRGIPGQSGAQQFFTLGDSAHCLYVVLGEHLWRFRLVPVLNDLLGRLRIS